MYCVLTLLLISISFAISYFRFPSEQTRLVVFRLGRFVSLRWPEYVLLIPFIERAVNVDLREQDRWMSWQGHERDDRT